MDKIFDDPPASADTSEYHNFWFALYRQEERWTDASLALQTAEEMSVV